MFRNVLAVLLLFAVWAPARIVPDLFIVEMEDAGKTSRQASVSRQGVRFALEQRGGEVLDSFDRVMDALVVRMDEQAAGALATMPGVRKVYRVMEGHLEMDGALPLHRVYEAWQKVGGIKNAGAGVGIAIIDTGIDSNHRAFQDDSLAVPEGFPRGNRESDLAGANHKVIVARSYTNLLSFLDEPTTTDDIGHGTGVAMAAAGVRHLAPYAEVSGVAPRAWLGNYKVFTANGSTRSDIVIRAIEDAVNDGMKVINLSLGFTPALRPEDDPVVRAVQRATEAGVVVVKSMGNSGPDPNTGSSPASAPSVIAVGANWNSRALLSTATIGDGTPYLALPGDGPRPGEPLQAPLRDVEGLDGTGLACGALPEGSLSGRIAFILRGECYFEDKLNNAARAGAVSALLYTDADRDFVVMAVGRAQLPGMMVSHADGLRIKERLAGGAELTVVLRFEGAPFPIDPNHVASFSSRGPTDTNGLTPDLLAVGVEVYTATQSNNPDGEGFDARGYYVVDGTSFSSPIVAGAAALVMSARPGLSIKQYRSLIVNSARSLVLGEDGPAPVQQAGAGILDVEAALKLNVTATPTSISFGAGGSTVDALSQISLVNIGGDADTFTITAVPHNNGPAPQVSVNSFSIASNGAQNVAVRFAQTGLAPGQYQGFLVARGTATDAELRIPYWYAVSDGQPGYLTLFSPPSSARTNATVTINCRVTDRSGVILYDRQPEVSVASGDGFVSSVRSVDSDYPGMWQIRLRMGPFPGPNVFEVRAGEQTRRISIRAN